MTILKLASDIQQFEDPNVYDKAMASMALGLPGSVVYGTTKGYLANQLNPKRYTPKKARRMGLRAVGIGTALSAATSPILGVFDDTNRAVGDVMLRNDKKEVKSQKEYDRMREAATVTGSAGTYGLAGSMVGGPTLGALGAAAGAKRSYLNEKLETKISNARRNVQNKFNRQGAVE